MLILRASKAAYIEYFTQTRFPISLLIQQIPPCGWIF